MTGTQRYEKSGSELHLHPRELVGHTVHIQTVGIIT